MYILKFIWRYKQSVIAKKILKMIKKSSVGFSLLNFKTYYKALVIDIFEFI